jgi:hypothetical protein
MIEKTITKYEYAKLVAKKCRKGITAKDVIQVEKHMREIIAEKAVEENRIQTHLGIFEMKDSPQGRVAIIPSTGEKVITGVGKKRIVYEPAPFFKEKLNGEKPQ